MATCNNAPVTAATELLFEATTVFDGRRFLDGPRWVLVRDGVVEAIESAPLDAAAAERRSGGVLLPGFVDAHVHLSFSDPAEVFAGGVTSVLDLGAPLPYAFAPHRPMRFRAAGPLLTAPGGYPTRSWGANGYGLEVTSLPAAEEAVETLADYGAAIVKVAIEPRAGAMLDDEALTTIVDAAHERKLHVAAHALGVDSVRSALRAGVDVLAHTPVERLPDDVVFEAGARGVAVISTVRAFGGDAATVENLAALAAAGCPIAYGTDLGNDGIEPGIDVEEVAILSEMFGGLDRALAAGTSVAAGIAGVGGFVSVGAPADLIWCPRLEEPADLRKDIEVWSGLS